MIKLEHTDVYGWEAAIRGMRNPMNSWDRSDSVLCKGRDGFEDCKINVSGECPRHEDFRHDIFCVGQDDYDLMMRLAKGGSVHAKYRRMITVTVDITAPLYWWKEFDTYKVGTVANSCSTMHKIHDKEFTVDDFSCEHLLGINDFSFTLEFETDLEPIKSSAMGCLEITAAILNGFRRQYLETNDKKYWWQMIQLLPSSYNQKRTILLNYEVLVGMYRDRQNHKLDEWHDFCHWIESLPYSEIITGVTVSQLSQ